MPRVVRVEPLQEAAAQRPILVDLLPEDLPADCHLQLLQNSNPRKSKQLQLHGDTERVRVDAVNYGPTPFSASTAYQYALLVVDDESREDGEVSIIGPCERLHHKRTVKALERAVDKAKEPEPEQLDYKTAQTALGEAFGTKKRRQAIHSVEKNQIDMDRLQASSAAFINKAIDDTIVSRLPTPAPSETGSLSAGVECVDNGCLPPYCISAEKAADCYPLVGKLIPDRVWRSLPHFNDQSAFSYSLAPGPFVQSALKTITFADPNDQRQYIAAYLTILLKLFPLKEATYNDPRTTQPLMFGLDAATQAAVLEAFSESVTTDSGRQRYKLPAVKKDRLALHICCLSLHLYHHQQVCLNDLADEMGLSVTKMQQYFKALGCVVETGGKRADGRNTQTRVARLQTPLTFPKPPLKR